MRGPGGGQRPFVGSREALAQASPALASGVGSRKLHRGFHDSRFPDEAKRSLGIEDKNSLLLGIKYEAAKLGGVEGESLRAIEEQLKNEVGGGWGSDEQVLAGRNAVRREHGLPGIGEPERPPSPASSERRPLWRRVLGR